MWLTSPKVLPIIMLVVLPLSATILGITLSTLVPVSLSEVGQFTYVSSYIYLISIGGLFYAIYPVTFRNIKRRGFSNLLIENACVKKILYFEIPILVIVIFLVTLFLYAEFDSPFVQVVLDFSRTIGKSFSGYNTTAIKTSATSATDDSKPFLISSNYIATIIFQGLMTNLGFSVTGGIIWMVLVSARKELGYFFAKTLFQTSTHVKDESKKAEYFIKATKLYDKYLRRTLNLEINDAKRIYSKILSDSNLNENESFQLISNSFDSNNKLEPIRTISKIMNVKETETFLVDESIGKRLKDMAIFFATIIPVAVAVIQLLLPKG
jgi:hypothetical protein